MNAKQLTTAFTVSVLVISLLVSPGSFVGIAAADSNVPITTDNATADNEQLPDTVYIDSAVRNASGETELILYLDSLSATKIRSAEDSIGRLQSHARTVQPQVQFVLDQSESVEIKSSSWLANSILISVDLGQYPLERLAKIEGVEQIGKNTNITTLSKSSTQATTELSPSAASEHTYGLKQIDVPNAWTTYNTQGDGVRVAVVDTGVDVRHPAIELYSDNRSDPTYPGGWAEFDRNGARVKNSVPYDTGSHGTHVSGTIAGSNVSGTHIGVAPDVELMHALGIDASEGGTTAQVIAAVEWSIVNDADIVSLSLGSSQITPADATWVRNTKAAGVHVVAASGNRGAGTVSSPAAVYDAFAVGATDQYRNVASFSSGDTIETAPAWGTAARKGWPSTYPVPDVTAPGVDVYSAVPDNGYVKKSGTSMSTPHVSGALALLIAASDDPNLMPTAYERALTDTATKPAGIELPQDTRYGHGIINVTAAIKRIEAYDGGIHGTVSDPNGVPLSDVTVRTQTDIQAITDGSGVYRLNSTSGETTVTAAAFGYQTQTRSTAVPEHGGITEDFVLEPTVEASIVSDVPRVVESGKNYDGTIRVGNTDSYTITLSDNSTVSPDSIEITLGSTVVSLGETIVFSNTVEDSLIQFTVQTENNIYNKSVNLEHAVTGVGTTKKVKTGQTTITSDLEPARFEITSFQAPEQIVENGSITINTTVTNTGERPGSQTIRYQVVGDGVDASSELETITLDPTETAHIEQTIETNSLGDGEYLQSVASEDDTSERPLTITEKRSISVAIEPANINTTSGTVQSFEITVSDPSAGISSFAISILSNNSSVVHIDSITAERLSGSGTESVSTDGTSASLQRVFDTDPYPPAENITIGTIKIAPNMSGTARLAIGASPTVIARDGSEYNIQQTNSADITVIDSPSTVDVTGDGNIATDTTGDGKFNDINGDGNFTIVDIQLFFQHRNTDVVQSHIEYFDFSGNGQLEISDVQILFDDYLQYRNTMNRTSAASAHIR